MVLVAERPDREVDRRHTPILTRLRLGVFDRPARVPVFLRELRGLVLPVGGNLAFLDRLLLFDRLRCLGVATIVATPIWPLIEALPRPSGRVLLSLYLSRMKKSACRLSCKRPSR